MTLLLAGCTVEPDYRRPEMSVPDNWAGPTTAHASPPSTQTSFATPVEGQIAQWWTTFNDPVLNSIIERTTRSNLDLQQAAARIRQARAARDVARAGFFPTVDATAG